ncbi:diguanylate cyclase [Gilvimarinus sp. F26214L]|uniref:diguanylate cyclase n=1 Tax=Gilvimarinus sp. DZF01 TaxID=3461371 RepID=UPI0040467DBD
MALRKPETLLSLVMLAAIVAVGALLAMDVREEYEREMEAVEEALHAETRLLAEHAKLSIHAAALLMEAVATDIRRSSLEQRSQDRTAWEALRSVLVHTPQVGSLIVADATGKVRITSTQFPAVPSFDVSDRAYFEAHRLGEHTRVGRPLVGRSSGRELIPLSLRLESPFGEFQGVIVAALDRAYFQSFFENLPSRLDRRIGMHLGDGTVLALYPANQALSSYSLAHVADLFTEVAERSWTGESPLDGEKRIIAYRFIEGYPVAVSVGYDYTAFLQTFYPLWIRVSSVFLLFATGIALATAFLRRSIRQAYIARQREHRLARRQRRSDQLARAITSHLPNGRVAVLDRKRRYLFVDGKGLSKYELLAPERIEGKSIREVHPPSVARVLDSLVRGACKGIESEGELHADGQTYKVTAVPLKDENARVDRVLLLTQDISDLKNIQRELEKRNLELEEMTLTDALLGTANRRAFDQELEKEWRRGSRKRRPLALLMVDVDHFKYYNDSYGHSRGDDCLRDVATALEAALLRPDDLLARYGGEELVVLLPECDLEGALSVAARIHDRLATEAIPFSASPGQKTVTVSIGAAAVYPHPDLVPATLVSRADEALYQAKERGRNRTVAAEGELTDPLSA